MSHACSAGIVAGASDPAEDLLDALRRAQVLPSDVEITYFDVAYVPATEDGERQRRQLFWDKAESCFDLVACSSAIRFFESLWGSAFISLLARKCKEGGVIVVPRQTNPSVHLSAGRLESLLGKGDSETIPNYSCFRRPQTIGGDLPSLLLWSAAHVDDADVRRFVAGRDGADPSIPGRLAQSGAPVDPDPDFEADLQRTEEFGARSDVFGDPASQFLRTFTYWIGGLAYKTPAVTGVAGLCRLQPGATLVDYGGGAGQLAVDCVLDQDCPIERATVVDLYPGNAAVFERISNDLRPVLQDRVRFVAGSFARWLPEQPVDMITCFGALLYLPRAAVRETLKAWWQKLKPGGVLLIHENVSKANTPPGRDRHVMFDGQELAAVLAPLGKQRYFGTTAMRELPAAAAADKSGFRFIQKPM
jgi:SAM-dependent methyltransferase